jgi:hypothetical protein
MTIALSAKAQQEFDKLTDKQKEIVKTLLPKRRKILFEALNDGLDACYIDDNVLEILATDTDYVPLLIRSFYQGLNVPPATDRTPEEWAELRAHPENYPNGPFVFNSAIVGYNFTQLLVDRDDFKYFIKQQPNWNKEALFVTIFENDDTETVLIHRKDIDAYFKRKTRFKSNVSRFTIIEPDGSSTTCKADELLPQ